MFKRILCLLFAFSISLAVHAVKGSELDDESLMSGYQAAIKSWTFVLETYVNDQGQIDFISLAKNTSELKKVVAFIKKVSPASHPQLFPTPEDVLAYHLNAYNALAMNGVIVRDIPKGFTNFFKRVSFFKFHGIVVGGEDTSLYDYENDVIRKIDDARLHFALNCMVKDCPRLPRTPFLAKDLDKQLESAAWEFFSKEKHFRLDPESKTVHISEILNLYTEDFVESGKAKHLGAYINQYLTKPIPEDYSIKFIDYDWRVNQQPK